MVALYHPKCKQASLHLNAGKREQGSCYIDISDENHLIEPIEAYLCFKSADGERTSDSIYLGNINGSYEAKVEKEINMKHTKLQTHFEQVKAKYQAAEALYQKTGLNKNALKQMEKEYQALQGRLENLPGKPV